MELIRPQVLSAATGSGIESTRTASSVDRGGDGRLRVEERFPYFVKRVAQARIWIESNGILFEKLQKAVDDYMQEIAVLCDRRSDALHVFPAPHDQSSRTHTSNKSDEMRPNALTCQKSY